MDIPVLCILQAGGHAPRDQGLGFGLVGTGVVGPKRGPEGRVVDSCRDLAITRRHGLRRRCKIVQAVAERP
jgi:hypothetical protein